MNETKIDFNLFDHLGTESTDLCLDLRSIVGEMISVNQEQIMADVECYVPRVRELHSREYITIKWYFKVEERTAVPSLYPNFLRIKPSDKFKNRKGWESKRSGGLWSRKRSERTRGPLGPREGGGQERPDLLYSGEFRGVPGCRKTEEHEVPTVIPAVTWWNLSTKTFQKKTRKAVDARCTEASYWYAKFPSQKIPNTWPEFEKSLRRVWEDPEARFASLHSAIRSHYVRTISRNSLSYFFRTLKCLLHGVPAFYCIIAIGIWISNRITPLWEVPSSD